MTDRQARHLEMTELALRAADGDLDAAGYATLESLLSNDAKAREDYAELMLTLSALDWDAGSQTHLAIAADRAVRQVILTDVMDEAVALRRQHEIEDEAQSLLLADLKDQEKEADLERRRVAQQRKENDQPTKVYVIPRALPWLGIAAAIVLMVAGIASFLPDNSPDKSPDDHADSSDPPIRQNAPPAVAPVLVANVNESLDAQWSNGQAVTPGQALYEGQTRTLEQGIVSLTLTNGVTLTLEAPLTFQTISNELVALSSGKMVGLVPDGAEGFTVRAPGMIIEDLGTEFAIEADRETGSHVEVLDGSVRLHPPSNTAADAGFAVEEIVVGEARQADASGGALLLVEAEPTAFYRAVPSPYERLIRDAQPLAYWRFNERNEIDDLVGLGSLMGNIPNVAASTINDRNVPSVCEKGDAALFLTEQSRALLSQGLGDGLNLTEDFTIEAWVWVPRDTDRRMRIVSNASSVSNQRFRTGYGFGITNRDDPENLADGPVLMFTGFHYFDAFTQATIPTDRWVHVAVSLDNAGNLAMFIEGQRQALNSVAYENSQGSIVIDPSNQSPIIGEVHTGGRAAPFEHWVGGIDELAMYGRVLSEEEIASHAQFDPESAMQDELENHLPPRDRR